MGPCVVDNLKSIVSSPNVYRPPQFRVIDRPLSSVALEKCYSDRRLKSSDRTLTRIAVELATRCMAHEWRPTVPCALRDLAWTPPFVFHGYVSQITLETVLPDERTSVATQTRNAGAHPLWGLGSPDLSSCNAPFQRSDSIRRWYTQSHVEAAAEILVQEWPITFIQQSNYIGKAEVEIVATVPGIIHSIINMCCESDRKLLRQDHFPWMDIYLCSGKSLTPEFPFARKALLTHLACPHLLFVISIGLSGRECIWWN